MKLTTSVLRHNSKSSQLDVILPGVSAGIDSPFIQKIIDKSQKGGNSTLAINFPFFEREEEQSSGPELKEELETLKTYLTMVEPFGFQKIRLIGKSLGGIVASYYLREIANQSGHSIVVLGYIVGDIDLKGFNGDITVIQGEKDRFGDIESVKSDLNGAASTKIEYHSVANADHSYRNPDTKEPLFEDNAINLVPER